MNKDQVLERLASAKDGVASLSGAWIEASDFGSHVFEAPVNFAGASFAPDVSFAHATFKHPVSFDGAHFKGRAGFEFCRFEQGASFSLSTFDGEAEFARSTFGGTASFWNCTFRQRASLREVCVVPVGRSRRTGSWQEQVNFSWSCFHQEARFGYASFQVPAYFWRTVFRGNALLDECGFEDLVRFEGRQRDVLLPRFGVIEPSLVAALEEHGLFAADTEHHTSHQGRVLSTFVLFRDVLSPEHLRERLGQLPPGMIGAAQCERLLAFWQEKAQPMFARGSVVSFRNSTFRTLSDESFSHIDFSNVSLDASVAGDAAAKEEFRRALERRTHDVFICHASEDKEEFVRPLAEKLREMGLVVWYDEANIGLGQSLSGTIELGLSRSRFGVVVITPSFLKKTWSPGSDESFTRKELEQLSALSRSGNARILPVWRGVTREQVLAASAALADALAYDASQGGPAQAALVLAKRIYGWT
jgi:hypothetical protein